MLGAANDGIAPPTEAVTLAIGDLVTQLPAGSFHVDELGRFMYESERLAVVLTPAGSDTFAYAVKLRNADLTSTSNPVRITIAIGDDRGTTTANAGVTASGTVPTAAQRFRDAPTRCV